MVREMSPPRTTFPAPTWEERFDRLDLVTPTNPNGRWRANDVWQGVSAGYVDFATGGSTFNLNPNQTIAGAQRSPFEIRDGVLHITARRIPSAWRADIDAAGGTGTTWAGGMLISNTARAENRFGYGYYAWRVRVPKPARGMFPAAWMFAANGQNAGKEQAELDTWEVFGYAEGRPWDMAIHQKKQDGTAATGATVAQRDIGTRGRDTRDWHVVGIDWQESHIRWYYDGAVVAELPEAEVAFFRGVTMSLRVDMVMDASWFPASRKSTTADTPDAVTLEVDWIRRWDSYVPPQPERG